MEKLKLMLFSLPQLAYYEINSIIENPLKTFGLNKFSNNFKIYKNDKILNQLGEQFFNITDPINQHSKIFSDQKLIDLFAKVE